MTDTSTYFAFTSFANPQPGAKALPVSQSGYRVLQAQPETSTTRVITYTYDGLQRLTEALESTGANYTYGYDLAGNRTSVTVNGSTTTKAYNAANQVVGWNYDAAGNLLSDGTSTSAYDALGRMTSRGGASYRYNGNGVLVAQSSVGNTTHYAQDMVAALSQVLSDGSANYLYGLDRLAAQAGGTTTWYASDALGSVRQTLDNSGTPLATASYDPWGTPQGSAISPFGFTGELQDAAGLTYLRARWYTPGTGTFTAYRWRSDESWDTIPYSNHPYAYALSNPTLYTDPTGKYFEGDDGGYGYSEEYRNCQELGGSWNWQKGLCYVVEDDSSQDWTSFLNPAREATKHQQCPQGTIELEAPDRVRYCVPLTMPIMVPEPSWWQSVQKYCVTIWDGLPNVVFATDGEEQGDGKPQGSRTSGSQPPPLFDFSPKDKSKLNTILKRAQYASNKGNCRLCANELVRKLKDLGYDAEIVRLENYNGNGAMLAKDANNWAGKMVATDGWHNVVRIKTAQGDFYLDRLVYEHFGDGQWRPLTWKEYDDLWMYPGTLVEKPVK